MSGRDGINREGSTLQCAAFHALSRSLLSFTPSQVTDFGRTCPVTARRIITSERVVELDTRVSAQRHCTSAINHHITPDAASRAHG